MEEELEEGFIHDQYGYCYYAIDENNACIYNLWTEPKYRQKGYAKFHIQYCINKIREYGYKGEIAIEAAPRNNSIAVEKLATFYSSCGLYVINNAS
jgi:GNAT superfamily N-acetyltransferase